ncbi:MAG: hypothetical protein K9M75_13140 [Phycisphaerae bacterium]|nr:hypothetical protein [Phycisphaerae bacterium]
MNLNNNVLGKVISRFLIYTFIVFTLAVSLPIIIERGDVSVFSENGPIELIQLAIILASVTLLLLDCRFETCEFKQLFLILGILQACAGIRELDLFFDRIIPVIGWKLPVMPCVLLIALIWHKNSKLILAQAKEFIRTRSFALLWCGFIIAVPYSQLVGHGKFLELLMGDDYVRDYKRVIEELGELLGYLLIMVGSIEAVLQRKED